LKLNRIFLSISRLILSLALLLFIFFSFDFEFDAAFYHRFTLDAFLILFLMVALQIILLSYRFYLVTKKLSLNVRLLESIKLTLVSLGFGQVFFGALGQDFYKFAVLKERGDWKNVSAAIISDRAVGLLALLFIIFIFSSFGSIDALPIFPVPILGLGLLIFICIWCAIYFWLGRRNTGGELFELHKRLNSVFLSSPVFALSLVVHCVSALFFALILATGGSLEMSIDLVFQSGIALLISIVLSYIPVTAAGWGVREGYLAFHLGFYGFDPKLVIGSSVLFGLFWAAAGIVGIVTWAVERKSKGVSRCHS